MGLSLRISAWHIVATVLLMGCITLVLSLLSPEAALTTWFNEHWQNLGGATVGAYLLFRFLRPLLPSAEKEGDNADLASHEQGHSSESMDWFRAKTLQEAANLPVPDAVYRIVEFNSWATLKIMPSELNWLASVEQFETWSQKANLLRLTAYEVGDAGLSKNVAYDAIRKKFIADNPGFSEKTYERAISYGYQSAR